MSRRAGLNGAGRRGMPDPPDMSRVDEFRLLTWDGGYKTVSWPRINSDYLEQIEGQRYPEERIKRDLAVKRDHFERTGQVAWFLERGFTHTETGGHMGISPATIKYWMKEGLPRQISSERHKLHQSVRRKVSINTVNPEALGYFLGLASSGRVKPRRGTQKGISRYIIHADSREFEAKAKAAIRDAFGISPKVLRPKRKAPGAHKYETMVALDSAEFARYLRHLAENPAAAIGALPDHPDARRGFTHAVFDKGAHSELDKYSPRVVLWHRPEATAIVSKTLDDLKIPHIVSEVRGKWGLVVPKQSLPAFKRHIGFTEKARHNKLPG